MSLQSQETAKKTKTKTPLKLPKERRERYLMTIDYCLTFAVGKINSQYTQSGQKVALLRATASLIATGGSLLRDTELENIEARLAVLEESKDL
jgi:hypothetical protein